MEQPEAHLFRGSYIISMSETTSTTCDVNVLCCSLILEILGESFPFPCPFTSATFDARSYLRNLLHFIMPKLVNLGLVRSCKDTLPFDLIKFVLDFTSERHVCPSDGPSLVNVARISVEDVEDEGLEMTGWAKRAARGSVEALVARVRAREGDDEGCVVCFEGFEGDMAKMPCGHVFHGECIGEWLKKSFVCPLCRFEMPFELFKISRRLASLAS